MNLYSLYHSKPLPQDFDIQTDGGSRRIDDHLLLIASSQSIDSLGIIIRQKISGSCPVVFSEIKQGSFVCGDEELNSWTVSKLSCKTSP